VGAGVEAGEHAAKTIEAINKTNRVTNDKRFMVISF
jgi:hypothetical protein